MVASIEEGAQDGVALLGVFQADALQMLVKNVLGLAHGFARGWSMVVNASLQHVCRRPAKTNPGQLKFAQLKMNFIFNYTQILPSSQLKSSLALRAPQLLFPRGFPYNRNPWLPRPLPLLQSAGPSGGLLFGLSPGLCFLPCLPAPWLSPGFTGSRTPRW